jgi:hypothetical protein
VRLAVARDQGLDEATIAKGTAEHRVELSPSQQAALDFADALMTMPALIPAALIDRLHTYFSPAELVELSLDVMKWNAQKVPVALGIDDWVRPGELTDLVFDAEGRWVR